jgi:hypothetical protein
MRGWIAGTSPAMTPSAQQSDRILLVEEISKKFILISPIWIWALYVAYFTVALVARASGLIFLIAVICTVMFHVGWAFFSRRWLIGNFDLNPIINKRHSDLLFLLSITLFIILLIIQFTWSLQYADQDMPILLKTVTDIIGSLVALGVFFFPLSAPLALVKAENKPSNFGGRIFLAFMMYLYLPFAVFGFANGTSDCLIC